jgi:hypothetical protein
VFRLENLGRRGGRGGRRAELGLRRVPPWEWELDQMGAAQVNCSGGLEWSGVDASDLDLTVKALKPGRGNEAGRRHDDAYPKLLWRRVS